MQTVTLARHAMATRFELVLHGDHPAALRAAGEEALNEVDRLERLLSLYRPTSGIAQINARAAHEPVRVTPEVFALLQHAQRLHAETGGAFDISIAPLVRCWGFMSGKGKMPALEEVAEARAKIGMRHVQLDPQDCVVRFERDGMLLDLGAIGKGYAVGQAAELLREAGVTSALIHGGTSTVYAIGSPPEGEVWKIAMESPPATLGAIRIPEMPVFSLRDEALSVSAMWGRSFQLDGTTFGHVIDPRTGEPVRRALAAAIILPSATETDALSTALLVSGAEGLDRISQLRSGMKALILAEADGSFRVECKGISFPPEVGRGLDKMSVENLLRGD